MRDGSSAVGTEGGAPHRDGFAWGTTGEAGSFGEPGGKACDVDLPEYLSISESARSLLQTLALLRFDPLPSRCAVA